VATGLSPGVRVSWHTRVAPDLARIDVAGFVGIAERGPTDAPRLIESWPQFVAAYGDFQANAFLGYAVRGFFDNGGQRCHIVRVAAPERLTVAAGVQATDGTSSRLADPTGISIGALATIVQDAATIASGAQPADRRSSVVAATAGFVAGARVAIRQAGRAPIVRTLVRVDGPTTTLFWQTPLDAALDLTLPFTLAATTRDQRLVQSVMGDVVTWTRPLDGRFDLAAPIDFALGSGTAAATLWDEQGAPILNIRAASAGRWGDAISVRVTASLSPEIATRRREPPDSADHLTLTRLTALMPGAIVDCVQAGVPMVRNRIVAVDVASSRITLAHALVGFDFAGAADGTKPIRVRRHAFALSVRERGRLIETFTDLDLPTLADPETSPVNARSALVRLVRTGADADAWVDPGSAMLRFGEADLAGGRDGIAMLRPRDVIGSADEPSKHGLRLYEDDDEPAALAIPDLLLPPISAVETLPSPPKKTDPCDLCAPPDTGTAPPPFAAISEATPDFGFDDVVAVQQTLVEHCEARGDRMAVLDPPRGHDFDRPSLFDWRQRFDSSYAATYFPWVAVVDPIARAPERMRLVPPSGHALGGYAAADADPGRDAPANRMLNWVSALPRAIDDEEHALFNDKGINAIVVRPGRGIRVMGARTLSSAADWQQLVVRRLLLRLKRSLSLALRWAVFEPNNATLENDVVATIESLLEREWEARRLAGSSAEDAFAVAIRRGQDDADAGRFIVDIAVAPALPAEFVFLQLVRSLDRLDLAEAQSTQGWPR